MSVGKIRRLAMVASQSKRNFLAGNGCVDVCMSTTLIKPKPWNSGSCSLHCREIWTLIIVCLTLWTCGRVHASRLVWWKLLSTLWLGGETVGGPDWREGDTRWLAIAMQRLQPRREIQLWHYTFSSSSLCYASTSPLVCFWLFRTCSQFFPTQRENV